MNNKFILGIALLFGLSCLWDNDTIEMERQQFPNVLELITGNFLHHSPEFYYWRLKDREDKLAKGQAEAQVYDDLAVAYAKLGYLDKAIALMESKENKYPGLYETQANLGTFYLHKFLFIKGLEHIKKALEINSDAHFGREKYQAYLAEYLLYKMVDHKIPFPLGIAAINNAETPNQTNKPNFYDYLVGQINPTSNQLDKAQLEEAIAGITGMMKFGNFESPILLEVLGDLLMQNTTESNDAARFLAARAYLKASYAFNDQNIKDQYNLLIEHIMSLVEKSISPRNLGILLNDEIAQGTAFSKEIANNELEWIISGKDPEKEFSTTYYDKDINPVVLDKKISFSRESKNFTSFNKDALNPTYIKLEKEPLRMIDPMVEAYLEKIIPDAAHNEELPNAVRERNVPHINNRNPVSMGVILAALGIFGLIVFLLKYFDVL